MLLFNINPVNSLSNRINKFEVKVRGKKSYQRRRTIYFTYFEWKLNGAIKIIK